MTQFRLQPYRLHNTIQQYDWGTRNENAFIPRFLGIEPLPDTPYAELWIGAHPKSPSAIDDGGRLVPLNEVIAAHPMECLGAYTCRTFSNTFPFLLKVLSAERALSIQTHPNKAQAELLHARDPRNYPDDNHKPEIAIAIDTLTALAGFKPVPDIIRSIRALPELYLLTGWPLIDELFRNGDSPAGRKTAGMLYASIMEHSGGSEKLTACVDAILTRLRSAGNGSREDEQFMKQHAQFGADVGLFSFFFFNLVDLKPGEAIFTDAGIPHAYIRGTIIECMANSDNVIRAGLTNKYKDVPTLLDTIRYEFTECPVMNTGQFSDTVTYGTPAKEFRVSRIRKRNGLLKECIPGDRPVVYLVMDGVLEVGWSAGGSLSTVAFSRGDSFLIPAGLLRYELKSAGPVEFFEVTIP